MVDRLVNSEANSRRIGAVENSFGAAGQPLAIPGRVLVGEGILVKMCRKKPKQRQFFLFNDLLVYGTIIINKKKYSKQHVIPLETVKLENLPDDEDLKNGWLLKTERKSFAVYAATATEKTEWMSHIERCIDELLSKGKKAGTHFAAVWVPDREAPRCMRCNKTEFNLLQRRHHCRHCGVVVCNACSQKRFLLPQQSKRPVRVCSTCYDKLTKGYNADFAEPRGPIGGDSSTASGTMGDDPDDSGTSSEDEDDGKPIPLDTPTFYQSAPPPRPPPPNTTNAT